MKAQIQSLFSFETDSDVLQNALKLIKQEHVTKDTQNYIQTLHYLLFTVNS